MGKIWTYLDMNTSYHKKKKKKTLRSFQRACISMRPAKPKKKSQENAYQKLVKSHMTLDWKWGLGQGQVTQYIHEWQQAPQSNMPSELLAGKDW